MLTEAEYEAKVIAFLGGDRPPGIEECRRESSGDLVRFNPMTQEYGVANQERFVLTYFKPRPCASIPHWLPKVNCHGEKDNMEYFRRECSS